MALEPPLKHDPVNLWDDFNSARLERCDRETRTCSISNQPKLKWRTSWFLPKPIVATGHDQWAVSVEMNLWVKTHQHTPTASLCRRRLYLAQNLRLRRGRNEPATFSNTSQFSRPISSRSRQTGGGGRETNINLALPWRLTSAFHSPRGRRRHSPIPTRWD